MKNTTIFCRKSALNLFFILFLLSVNNTAAQSVPVYATSISSQDHVDFSSNAIDGNLTTRARIRASSGIALGIGDYDGHVELEFPSLLPANTTSFVKIQTDDNLLPAILGGSLGGLLSDVLGGVLIGNQEFTVQAKNNNSIVLFGNSQTISEFSTPRLRVVVNGAGDYFLALTPSQAYNRIRLTNRLGSLVGLNNTKRLDVYEAFYIGTPDPCGGASYTSFDGSGLSLDLLGLGGAGVANPQNVIDANPNNFSRLSLGILNVAGSIEQTVYFDDLSASTDQFFIRMKIDPSLLTLGVVNNIQVIAYNGPDLVQTVNLNSLLNLDLLTLLQGNQVARIRFSPGSPVSRITVRYNSLLNVQLTQSLDLYGIVRAPANPTITDSFTSNPVICAGSTASLIAQTVAGTELNWYSQAQGGTILATTTSGQPFVTGILNADTSYYVSARKIGCTEESLRIRINVDVIALPTATSINIANELNACNGSVVLAPTASNGGTAFRYYKDQAKTRKSQQDIREMPALLTQKITPPEL
ncbi:immunoglobulin domain-containing protein [Flavobacterium sp. 3HN19-14]|uniref:immunoglobulin domain-containing protein n=1 Tax=Flavobacterium sp. 3HN19-14 TaxID=3448133 RepID=UPI003EE1BF61